MELTKINCISIRRKHTIAFLCLSILILASYSNSFRASWHFDDELNITENRRLHLSDLSLSGIADASLSSPRGKVPFYRPVSRLSLALNYYFGGEEVLWFHAVNVLIHITASIFLYLTISTIFNLPLLKTRYGSHSFVLALFSALFWAVHPIQTQAVTYIVQRMTAMTGMFYIMSLYFYARSSLATEKKRRGVLLAFTALFGLLALGSKENAIMIPVSLLLFELLFVDRSGRDTWKRDLKVFLLFYLLPLAAALIYLELSHEILTRIFTMYETRTFSLLERILTEPRAVLFYMSLLLYPVPGRFSIDHDFVVSESLLTPPTTILSILFLLCLLILIIRKSGKSPLLSFSLLFFLLNHAPESTILPMELVFEHRNYIPSMFFFVPVSAAILNAILLFSTRRSMRMLIAGSTVLLVIALGHSTLLRNAVWRNEKTLWEDVLYKYPGSFRAHNNLGRHHTLIGEEEKARQEYYQALNAPRTQRRSEKAITFFNLGYLDHIKGDNQRAVFFYGKALELDPCCPRANNNLAAILLETGKSNFGEALRLLEKALECGHDAELPRALSNMGILLMRMGRKTEAMDALSRAMEMGPENLVTRQRLGYVLKENGYLEEALVHFNRLLNQVHDDIPSFLFAAEVHLLNGRIQEAKHVLDSLLRKADEDDLLRFLEDHKKEWDSMEGIPCIALLLPILDEVRREKGQAPGESDSGCP